ncbi:hypothetical protein KEM48_014297 [Puccinia striiformis f. sp. tritici PST-130]|nr:hypothetical protein KEM48_014297 [Puccinia striiformis f. sp. tritici PST-130]
MLFDSPGFTPFRCMVAENSSVQIIQLGKSKQPPDQWEPASHIQSLCHICPDLRGAFDGRDISAPSLRRAWVGTQANNAGATVAQAFKWGARMSNTGCNIRKRRQFWGRNRMETSSKTLRQSDQALSMTFIDRDPVPGDQSKVFDAEAELASNPFDHVVEKNGHPEAGPLTSKTAQWKRLEGNIEQKKFNAYHLYLSDLRGASLILHEGNREEWKSQEIYRANEKDAQAFFEHMNPDFKLGSKFNLYNFLIERSLSEQKLWWSKEDYEALQVKSDFQSDDVQLTIQAI